MSSTAEQNTSTIYGPVRSWRFGQSVGVDLLFQTSICSFNCVYCQLGDIQEKTARRQVYIPTEQVISDFEEFLEKELTYDVITFSGSGEPTLASNISQVAEYLKSKSPTTPLQVLTNGTKLNEIGDELNNFDRVIVKLDAPNQKILDIVNQPVAGVNFEELFTGIKEFRQRYQGTFDIQMMFMPANHEYINDYIKFLKELSPDHVQLNTPKRPYPLSWHRENRGLHSPERDYETRTLKVINEKEAKELEETLSRETGLDIVSIYR